MLLCRWFISEIYFCLGGLLGGLAIGNILNRGQSRSRRFRGRRDASSEQEDREASLARLMEMEPEDCYKMVLCAANTGK